MSITVNILYTGTNGNAQKFATEMIDSKIVDAIRAEPGNQQYAYFAPLADPESILLIDQWSNQAAIDFHHKSPMMHQIAELRTKYHLKMTVKRYAELPNN